jgi:hypothetical protein
MTTTAAVSLTAQIACVRREISMRERVYPRWVEAKRLTQRKADDEIHTMRAVLATLEAVNAKPDAPGSSS